MRLEMNDYGSFHDMKPDNLKPVVQRDRLQLIDVGQGLVS